MPTSAAPRPRVPGRRLLLVVAGWLAASAVLVAATAGLSTLARPGPWAHRQGDLGTLYMLEAYVALVIALAAGFGGSSGLSDRLGFHFTAWRHLALAPPLWLTALIAGGALTAALGPILDQGGPDSTARLFARGQDPFFLGLTVVTVVVVGPAAEEMLFRGALFGWLRGRTTAVVAGVLSAVVFAAAHLLPAAFPFLFVFGLAAALMYHRTGSTLNSFAMHLCQNAVAVAVTLGFLGGRPPGG